MFGVEVDVAGVEKVGVVVVLDAALLTFLADEDVVFQQGGERRPLRKLPLGDVFLSETGELRQL